MAQKLTVSVIIPVFDEAKHIEKTLMCLQRQTILADEIIVVDNNSTDATKEIVNNFSELHPQLAIRLVHESRQGIACARSCGFDAAKSDILGRIDGDTQLARDWVERLKEDFLRDESILCVGGPLGITELSRSGKVAASGLGYRRQHALQKKLKLEFIPVFGCNMAIRSSAWRTIREDVQTDSQRFHEDLDIVFALSKIGKIFCDRQLRAKVNLRNYLKLRKILDYRKKDSATREKHFGSMR